MPTLIKDFSSFSTHVQASEPTTPWGQNTSPIHPFHNTLTFALNNNASDIHLSPLINTFRSNSSLSPLPPSPNFPLLSSHIKIISNLSLDSNSSIQDGGFKYHHNDLTYTFRVSIIPTIHGESLALRIHEKTSSLFNLHKLGLTPSQITDVKTSLTHKNGLIIISGPTGSGKTTTLYALLNHLKSSNLKIISIEDPIECHLPHINQLPVHQNSSYNSTLKSILRQSPDVIVIGEIRDPETAQIALQAALTGHLVITTLHASSPPHTLLRLSDLNLNPNIFQPTIKMIINQNLQFNQALSQKLFSFEIKTRFFEGTY